MKRRVLSMVLALVMALTLLPATALADGESYSENTYEITVDEVTKSAEHGQTLGEVLGSENVLYKAADGSGKVYYCDFVITEALNLEEVDIAPLTLSEYNGAYYLNIASVEGLNTFASLVNDTKLTGINGMLASDISAVDNNFQTIGCQRTEDLEAEDEKAQGVNYTGTFDGQYDNAKAWRDLLRANRNIIADAMNISASDFRWYAAFHDEGEHPHVHMMAWSVKPGQAYLNTDGIREIKSALTNQIFRQEMLHLYEQKSESRDELVWQARKEMAKLTREMREKICDFPEVEQLMQELVTQLETVTGKKSYGYLTKPQKKIVDKIVDEMSHVKSISDCYDRWLELQGKVESYYHSDRSDR